MIKNRLGKYYKHIWLDEMVLRFTNWVEEINEIVLGSP